MGALVGGLYAMGYSPASLDSLVRGLDLRRDAFRLEHLKDADVRNAFGATTAEDNRDARGA